MNNEFSFKFENTTISKKACRCRRFKSKLYLLPRNFLFLITRLKNNNRKQPIMIKGPVKGIIMFRSENHDDRYANIPFNTSNAITIIIGM